MYNNISLKNKYNTWYACIYLLFFQSCIQHHHRVIPFKMLVLYHLHWIIGHIDRFVTLNLILLTLTWYQSALVQFTTTHLLSTLALS